MQQDSSVQITNPTETQNLKKSRYRYFTRYGELTDSNDLRKQMIRRTNSNFFNFEGTIDEVPNEGQNFKNFKELLSLIQSSKRISKVKLNAYREDTAISVRELLAFIRALKRHSTLQSLHFQFRSWKYATITDSHLKKLGQSLKALSKLQDVHLTFNPIDITRRGFYAIARRFNKADFLQTIDWEKSKVQQFEIKRLNGRKPHSKKLTNFKLAFQNQGIGGYRNRYKFNFYLDGPQKKGLELVSLRDLTAQGLQELNKTLEETQSFHHLTIKFNGSPDDHFGEIRRLSENLKRLSSLTSFDLATAYLSGGVLRIDAEYFVSFIGQSLEELTSLKHISLSIDGWEYLSGPFLGSFSTHLGRLSSLESVSIKIKNSDRSMAEQFMSLKEALTQLKQLQKLSLDFSYIYFNNNEIDFNGFFGDLEKLPSLKDFNLRLYDCYEITDEEIQLLSQDIKKISSLQTFGFNFHADRITLSSEAIEKLRENLAHLQCNIV